jgi:hypothetical protein
MEFKDNEAFNECVEKFKKLNIEDKKRITEKELMELIATLSSINKNNNIEEKVLFNREISDIKKDNSSYDDYVEAIYVYVNMIKELVADYIICKENK